MIRWILAAGRDRAYASGMDMQMRPWDRDYQLTH
tara:strand:+ start:307 stop:408 length:102 start_codon:yes stop_codon:yes gene_type:complete